MALRSAETRDITMKTWPYLGPKSAKSQITRIFDSIEELKTFPWEYSPMQRFLNHRIGSIALQAKRNYCEGAREKKERKGYFPSFLFLCFIIGRGIIGREPNLCVGEYHGNEIRSRDSIINRLMIAENMSAFHCFIMRPVYCRDTRDSSL